MQMGCRSATNLSLLEVEGGGGLTVINEVNDVTEVYSRVFTLYPIDSVLHQEQRRVKTGQMTDSRLFSVLCELQKFFEPTR